MRLPIWTALTLAVLLLASIFGVRAIKDYSSYSKYSKSTLATIESLSVTPVKSHFRLDAKYRFKIGEITYTGNALLPKVYPNRFAAEEGMKQVENPQVIYYSPQNPSDVTFSHHFPWKKTISALLILGVGIYFYTLTRYFRM